MPTFNGSCGVELREELGDLLLQVVFHARIAEEAGLFAFADVAAAIADKMERRHPHIFARAPDRTGAAADAAAGADWETIKAAERGRKTGPAPGALDGVALALPALQRAEKLQKRAARAGFDWPDAAGPAAKLAEEIDEFAAAATDADRLEEAGDLLFAAVNLLRAHRIDAEDALRRANRKFERRFGAMEALAAAAGRAFADLPPDRQEDLWQAVKRSEAESELGEAP